MQLPPASPKDKFASIKKSEYTITWHPVKTARMDRLYFYSNSKACVAGEGEHEFVQSPTVYERLPKNFRKVLGNYHVEPFKFQAYTFRTIEHAYQSEKIGMVSSDEAFKFTVESGHTIGKGNGNVARKHRKLCILNEEQLTKWNMIKDDLMKAIATVKYEQCPAACTILRATKKAQLWHYVPRIDNAKRYVHLEEIRRMLNRQ